MILGRSPRLGGRFSCLQCNVNVNSLAGNCCIGLDPCVSWYLRADSAETSMTEPIYFTRDLSWLQFNHRVLQEAADPSVPLYERLKFLAIYSSNLDEFFRVRVSSMRSFKKMKDLQAEMHFKPKRILKEIQAVVHEQQEEFGRIFGTEILPLLEENGITLVKNEDFNDKQLEFAQQYFDEYLLDHTTPHLLFEQDVDVWLENRALYLVAQLDEECHKVALIPIPSTTERFVIIPKSGDKFAIAFVDDIIRANIKKIFPSNHIVGLFAIKLSRDAELYLGDEFSGDLISRLEESVKDRKRGLPTRFLFDSRAPKELIKKLRKTIGISKYDLIPGARYHNFNDFFGFPDPSDNPAFRDAPMPPVPHPRLEHAKNLIDEIDRKDVILHFPYQKYDYVPQLILQAASDPAVKAIKITLYRVAHQSAIANALLKALESGKKVFTFIEAKARFDEESNLFWGKQLQAAGAQVRYSFPGIKVHSKLMMIIREEADEKRYTTYLGTGNFNEKTAKLYGDHALLTADQRIGREVARVFEMLEGKILAPQCDHLLVSPLTSRPGFMELVDREMRNARAGHDAWMILKMNSLEDKRMINKLYEASKAGVRIKLIVRGICCLVPGVEGLSENIEIISIVDRFLEHARVYLFANNGNSEMYLASADWMKRNLDRRVEVVFPIYDEDVKQEIEQIVNLQLSDNVKARVIDADQTNPFVERAPGETPIRAQVKTYELIASMVPEPTLENQ